MHEVMKASQSTAKPASITTPNDTAIRIERTFEAPRDVVFRAYTDPQRLSQWMGPRQHNMTIEQVEAHRVGRRRGTHIDTHATESGFLAELPQVPRPETSTQT